MMYRQNVHHWSFLTAAQEESQGYVGTSTVMISPPYS